MEPTCHQQPRLGVERAHLHVAPPHACCPRSASEVEHRRGPPRDAAVVNDAVAVVDVYVVLGGGAQKVPELKMHDCGSHAASVPAKLEKGVPLFHLFALLFQGIQRDIDVDVIFVVPEASFSVLLPKKPQSPPRDPLYVLPIPRSSSSDVIRGISVVITQNLEALVIRVRDGWLMVPWKVVVSVHLPVHHAGSISPSTLEYVLEEARGSSLCRSRQGLPVGKGKSPTTAPQAPEGEKGGQARDVPKNCQRSTGSKERKPPSAGRLQPRLPSPGPAKCPEDSGSVEPQAEDETVPWPRAVRAPMPSAA
mmetsp:Transcript_12814/g.35995  ORF Transcript_12814/g.35995 Transcript_12814/m.35995 type:complete len:307 (+) Transcript_12814:935-1855(+)